jgi:hypothetical protein
VPPSTGPATSSCDGFARNGINRRQIDQPGVVADQNKYGGHKERQESHREGLARRINRHANVPYFGAAL